MSVFKYHSFIYFLRPPPWYGTLTSASSVSAAEFGVRRFRLKKFFASKRNGVKQELFRTLTRKFFFRFISLLFAYNQSKINTPYFRFVSLPKIFCLASFRLWLFRFASKRNEINVFSISFTSKQNKINFFWLLFTSLGIDLTNWRTDLNIFLWFFTNCPRISLYPFSLWSFRFFFVFLLHFIFIHIFRIKAKKILLPLRFIYLSFSLCFIFVSLQISTFRIDAKQAK